MSFSVPRFNPEHHIALKKNDFVFFIFEDIALKV